VLGELVEGEEKRTNKQGKGSLGYSNSRARLYKTEAYCEKMDEWHRSEGEIRNQKEI